jgi:AcrR family transcriptional regulator
MTRDDIIDAAFDVWGRELYKTTSLSMLAERLGVSKPALYRHFPDKQALIDAMDERFYDDYCRVLRPGLADAAAREKCADRILVMVKTVTRYFSSNPQYAVFAMERMGGKKDKGIRRFSREMLKRGVDFRVLGPEITSKPPSPDEPSPVMFAAVTALGRTAAFHRGRVRKGEDGKAVIPEIKRAEVDACAEAAAALVKNGLDFDQAAVEGLDYAALEKAALAEKAPPPNALLKAVAQAVAEEGPWNATMESVAKKSGLSKSGLYAHFKSKADMLSQLFKTEFDRVDGILAVIAERPAPREEQLYRVMLAIAAYLRDRPEILVALDWVRVQRLAPELNLAVPPSLDRFFEGLKPGFNKPGSISEWISFLLVVVLMHRYHHSGKKAEVPVEALRKLFRFLALGIDGM